MKRIFLGAHKCIAADACSGNFGLGYFSFPVQFAILNMSIASENFLRSKGFLGRSEGYLCHQVGPCQDIWEGRCYIQKAGVFK